jgi:hypothetical protein
MQPVEELQFRGLFLGGESREWREVPYPEKLCVAQSSAQVQSGKAGADDKNVEVGWGSGNVYRSRY